MNYYLFFSFFLAIGFQSILAQDTLELPEYSIPYFINVKNDLNESTSIFPIIGEKKLHQKKDFGVIESTAKRIPDSLKLEYVEYYSENDPTWESEEGFENYFIVNANFDPYGNFNYSELNLVLDPIDTATIFYDKKAVFQSGISISPERGKIINLSKKIESDTSSQANSSGKIFVSVKYLTGYDTIMISKNQIGQNFILNHQKLHLQKIANGDLYFKSHNGSELKAFEGFNYVAYNDEGNIIHEPGNDVAPWRFTATTAIPSLFLNMETLIMTDVEYRNYLKKLKFSKSDLKAGLVILMTDLDFDKIVLLYPKYEFTPPRGLKVQVIRKNKDDLKLIKHGFPIRLETSKERRMNNN